MVGILSIFFWATSRPDVIIFKGVEGPSAPTPPVENPPDEWRKFEAGGTSRLAMLLTDTTSSWLGVAHGLSTIGIPFRITRDAREALRHDVVLVYPRISGRLLSPEALRALAAFPERGGTLIGVNVEGGGMASVFGFDEAVLSRQRRELVFDPDHPLAAAFTHERERRVPFSNPERGTLAAGSLGYTGAASPLAAYDDGTAAITSRRVGAGRAFAFGVDPGFLALRAYGNREEGLSRSYVNEYEPAFDVLLRTLLGIYETGQPDAVTLHTVPDGRRLTALITHDVDYEESLPNAEIFAQYEASVGVPATYFIQTKYVRDWNDEAFLDEDGVTVLRTLSELGMEIASHSVAHSLQFAELPTGSGAETYPTYQPFVRDESTTEGATVLGELRVSRFLLETLVPGVRVVSFRPGHLRNPYSLPAALERTGYRFSSSVTAGNALTHLPFRLTEGRGTEAAVPVFEFPVTIEDEREPALASRFDEAVALADQLGRYGGLFVVLIHTDETEAKLDFERKLVEALEADAWFGTLQEFGSFWAARDQVEVDVRAAGGGIEVVLNAPQPIEGLTLRLPKGFQAVSTDPAGLIRTSEPAMAVLGQFVGRMAIQLQEEGSAS
ncbi:MAG: hypothetical protein HKN72_07835 [Gemmatimonadetes bacterium]|nr:hypothetical protein [Gemmatimonadota bacterium]NNF13117.1 hypothetical protein [Gemmatimonadota bacterium]